MLASNPCQHLRVYNPQKFKTRKGPTQLMADMYSQRIIICPACNGEGAHIHGTLKINCIWCETTGSVSIETYLHFVAVYPDFMLRVATAYKN